MFEKIRELLSRPDTLEKKMFWRLSIHLTIVCFICFAVTLVEYLTKNISIIAPITALLCLIAPLVFMLICKSTEAYNSCYTVLTIIMAAILIPANFFTNGGFFSGMPLYCLAGITMCCFCVDKKSRAVSCWLTAIVCILCFVVALLFPGLVMECADETYARIDILLSFSIVAFSVISFYNKCLDEYSNAILRESKEAERKAEMRLELMNIQLENVADLKRIRHDVRHHDALILEYAQNGDLEGLKRYMKQKMYTDEYYATKIYCMNAVINNILTIYARRAQKENIEVNVNAEAGNTLKISEPDLVAVLSNLFENAIHGTREQEEGKTKKIDVDIHTKGERLIFKVSNTVNDSMVLDHGFPGHPGTGINSISKAVNSNDGTLSYKLADGMLTATAIMTIPGK